MDEKTIRPLKIEPKFKNLIRPLQRKEYLQLEQNILSDGCRDPIITWNGVIVDGHNRYEICMRHQIPFAVLEMDFSCEAEAIAWICANQLGRRNISEETRKYLIGKQFEAEKLAGAVKNPNGNNQSPMFILKRSRSRTWYPIRNTSGIFLKATLLGPQQTLICIRSIP